nr:MAG TPA: hypothetical protein [Caudoviricetes sp.]
MKNIVMDRFLLKFLVSQLLIIMRVKFGKIR